MPYSAGQYSSQPSSPANPTRRARTGTSPTVVSRIVRYGKSAPASDSGVSGASRSRERGPHSAKQAQQPGLAAQPAQVVPAQRGAGDHQVLVGGEPGHRDVQLDAGPLVERLGVD